MPVFERGLVLIQTVIFILSLEQRHPLLREATIRITETDLRKDEVVEDCDAVGIHQRRWVWELYLLIGFVITLQDFDDARLSLS